MSKVADSVVRIPCKINKTFFKYWFLFLQPFHHLTGREMEVIVSFVNHRYNLSKVISDNDILDQVTMSEDTKKKVMTECDISLPHFQVILGKLKKSGVILDGKINPKYIPKIVEENCNYKLMLFFDFING